MKLKFCIEINNLLIEIDELHRLIVILAIQSVQSLIRQFASKPCVVSENYFILELCGLKQVM